MRHPSDKLLYDCGVCVQDGVLTAYLGSAPHSSRKLILQEGLPPPEAPFLYLVRPKGAAAEEDGFCLGTCLDPQDILGAVVHLLENFADGNEHPTPNMAKLTANELPGEATKTLEVLRLVMCKNAQLQLHRRLLESIYALSESTLPGNLQQFRTAVVEAMSNMKGQTLLYVPGDDINDSQSALKDKVSSSKAGIAIVCADAACQTRCQELQFDGLHFCRVRVRAVRQIGETSNYEHVHACVFLQALLRRLETILLHWTSQVSLYTKRNVMYLGQCRGA